MNRKLNSYILFSSQFYFKAILLLHYHISNYITNLEPTIKSSLIRFPLSLKGLFLLHPTIIGIHIITPKQSQLHYR